MRTFDQRGHRRRFRAPAVILGLTLALTTPAHAEADEPVPGACQLHPVHVLNPGCVPALTDDIREPGITLPNIVPDVQQVSILRPFVFDEPTRTFVLGPPVLYFDTRAQNVGTVPLQLTVDDVESPDSSTVSQCVSWTERICREQRRVGGFTWHDEHTHFHFEEFATYELRHVDANGGPDYSESGLVAASDKVSFCLIDSERVREDALPVPVYNLCTPTVQGISPGWTDIYDSSLPGQQFSLEGLVDGRYALVISVDYGNRLHETDDSDNVIEATLDISAGLTQVSIVDRRWPASTN